MNTKTKMLCAASLLATLVATPALAQTLPQSQIPNAQEEVTEVDEVVVTGLRRSLATAQAIKRDSDSIVDAIVAEDIGKLPDVTASESLARVTGVQVTRAAGEAAQVAVRGLLDVSTTYSGREIFTAQDRLVAIQDFGAGTVAALEVYKSGTANLVEPGIGGLINVRSRKPFDFAGLEISGSVNAVYWEQAEEPSWNGNLLLSDRWETSAGEMGLLVNLAYSSVDYLDSTREQALFIASSSPGESPLASFRFPDSVQQFLGKGDRYRPTANAAFQWRPTDQLEIYVDALYQGYRGRDEDIWNYNPLWGGATFTDVVLRPGTNEALSLTARQGRDRRSDGYKVALDRNTDTWQIGAGLVWTGERLTVSADVATTESTVTDEKVNVDYAYTGPTTLRVRFDGSGEHGGPSFDLVNYDARNPANVLYRGLFEERARNEGQDVQFRTDLSYEAGWGPITSIQAGLRATDRDAMRQYTNRYAPGLGLGLNISQLGLELETVRGFAFDNSHPFGGIILPTRDSIMNNVARLRTIAGQPAGNVAFPNRPELDANERTFAGYLQGKFAFDGAIPIDGVIGIRGVKTETTVAGVRTSGGVATEISRTSEYTDWLPNISARARLRDDLQLRLAYTETRTRPNFGDLNPSFTIEPTQTNNRRNASGGRVDLEPFTSSNYDATLEWYFDTTGSATLAVFRREVEGFIERRTDDIADPDFPGGVIRFNGPFNARGNDINGFEIGYTNFFDIEALPDWARNFGVQANYTRLEDGGDVKLRFLSEDAVNLIGIYETSKFSARLAYNYRSDYIEFVNGDNGVNNPIITEARGQFDFSASYTPIENVTIAFDVGNITGEPLVRSRAFNTAGSTYDWNVKYLERVYSLGVRFRY